MMMMDASSLDDRHLNEVIELSLVLRLIWWIMSSPSLQSCGVSREVVFGTIYIGCAKFESVNNALEIICMRILS